MTRAPINTPPYRRLEQSTKGVVVKKIVSILAVILTMSACSSGSPSQSEIEDAVTSAFKGRQLQQCDRILIENIKKANGIQVDDSTYQIMATYDVRIEPVGHKEEVDAARAKVKEVEEQRRLVRDELRRMEQEHGVRYVEAWIGLNPGAIADEFKRLLSEQEDLGNTWANANVELERKVKEVRKEWGSDYCNMIIGSGFGTGIFQFKDSLEAITSGGVNSFERTFNMVKTDNGWMELQ